MLSGILDFFDDKHIARIENGISIHGGNYEDIIIESKTVEGILLENNITKVDYCSIDTEGAELQIIKSIDFNRFSIKAISVENNNRDKQVRNFLNQKGYYCIPSRLDVFYVKGFNIKHIPFIIFTVGYFFCCGMKSVFKRLCSKIK